MGANVIRGEPVNCLICGRLYRVNFRAASACSTMCINALRERERVTGGQILKHPSWKASKP